MFIIKIEKIFLLITTVLFVGCTNPPRMIRGYDYSINKYETLEICKTILEELEYEIDIYSSPSLDLSEKRESYFDDGNKRPSRGKANFILFFSNFLTIEICN